MKHAKHVSENIQSFLSQRAQIEEEYAKKLAKLAKSFDKKEEIGTMRAALDCLRDETETCSQAHLQFADEVRGKVERPLQEFNAQQSVVRKNVYCLKSNTFSTTRLLTGNYRQSLLRHFKPPAQKNAMSKSQGNLRNSPFKPDQLRVTIELGRGQRRLNRPPKAPTKTTSPHATAHFKRTSLGSRT